MGEVSIDQVPIYRDENWLIEQYWGFDLTQNEMAKTMNCDPSVINNWMKKYDVPRKDPKDFQIICTDRDEQNRKRCPHCEQWKSETCFSKYKRSTDGLHHECKKCMDVQRRNWDKRNKQHTKNYQKNYSKKYRLNNEEKLKNYHIEYYKNNKNKILPKRKEYHQKVKHTENHKNIIRKMKAKRRNMKFIPLLINPFPEEIKVHYHHINNLLVIPLPKETHYNTCGKNHREKCNEQIKDIYGLDLNNLLGGS